MSQDGNGKEHDGEKGGCNWRETLTNFAAISGTLAGFSVTFIALILGGRIADTIIQVPVFTFGQVAILLFGISAGLFICASEFFLHAKEFDVYKIPDRYWTLFKDNYENDDKKIAEFEDKQTILCRRNEARGRRCYNIAIFMVFIGLFFAIAPYNLVIAIIVAGFGMAIETWQVYH